MSGTVGCGNNGGFVITIYPPDYDDENLRDKITCYGDFSDAIKICKALGTKEIYDDGSEAEYQL